MIDMTQHRWPVVTGDRVALAPHTDDWMRGRRFGTVTEIVKVPAVFSALRYRVEFDDGGARNLMADALLGAVGDMERQPNEYGFTCAEFDEDGSCIHSEHMAAAGL